MATQFHRLKIQEVRRETPNTVSLSFEIPSSLTQTFAYESGQYLTLKAQVGGEELRRSYSLCSSPEQQEWRVAIKQVPDGRFSTWANTALQAGMELEVMPPMGNFKSQKIGGHQLAIAAGSGITPVIAIVREGLTQTSDTRFTLFFGNRKHEDIIFHEEIKALQARFPERLQVNFLLSQEQRSGFGFGRLDEARLESAIRQGLDLSTVEVAYICGPAQMIFSLRDELESSGLASDKIKFELFSTPETETATEPVTDAAAPAPANSGELTATYILDGEQFVVPLVPETTILDIGLAKGIDLPFACQGGVCCTCRAKVVSGKVDMRQNFSLGEGEVSDGFVLTCQSYSEGESVTIDFDA